MDILISMTDNYLFIDDSGSKDWKTPYSRDFVDNPPIRNSDNRSFWQDNYFVLAGIHVSSDTMSELNPIIDKAKNKYFGTKHVELHSASLRFPSKRKKQYIDKFGISEEKLSEFVNDFWYKLFEEYPLQSIAIVVDKRYYKNPRFIEKTPLDIAAVTLFDRTEMHPNSKCRIVFDQMDKHIKARTGSQGKVLQLSNTKIELNGKQSKKYHHISVDFDNSTNSNFLQLADMVAYNVWRQFVDYGDEWDIHSPEGEHRILPTYPYFDKISSSFYTKDARLSGIGLIKVPDPYNKSKSWKLSEKQ